MKNYSRKSRSFKNHAKVNTYFTDHEKIENQFPRMETYRFTNHGKNKSSFTFHAKQKCPFTPSRKMYRGPSILSSILTIPHSFDILFGKLFLLNTPSLNSFVPRYLTSFKKSKLDNGLFTNLYQLTEYREFVPLLT